MHSENLLNLNQRGIFPGPTEQRDQFLKRAAAARQVTTPQEDLKLTKELFNAVPDWVNIHFGKKGLHPWEGAATWIEEDEEGLRFASIQIKSSIVARLYPQREVIAHEMVHAMRLMFNESRFEEILAFQTSKNRFRRYFGPLFTRPNETKGFVIGMFCSWVFYWTECMFDFSLGAKYVLLFPMLALAWGIWRLAHSQKIFSSALHQLEKAIKKPGESLAVALRLTDREIEQFANASPEEISIFAEKEKENDLRWAQLFLAYFN